jgi:Transmembrane protein of unknown function (DUF3556)/Enoyl-CoA hydratase/isomerase
MDPGQCHQADAPQGLPGRPAAVPRASLLAHIGGTFVEVVTPLILLFTTNPTVAVIATALVVCFNLFITSTGPLAVPLERNILFAFGAAFLFFGHPNWDGYSLGDMTPALLALTVVGVLFFPVLGNLRPDLVSFLPSMRQYAGNWASAMWAFAPGAETRLDERLVKPSAMTVSQLTDVYGRDAAEVVLHLTLRRAFSVGADLKERSGMTTDDLVACRPDFLAAYRSLLDLAVPVLAAIHGSAVGGLLELAPHLRPDRRRRDWRLSLYLR